MTDGDSSQFQYRPTRLSPTVFCTRTRHYEEGVDDHDCKRIIKDLYTVFVKFTKCTKLWGLFEPPSGKRTPGCPIVLLRWMYR